MHHATLLLAALTFQYFTSGGGYEQTLFGIGAAAVKKRINCGSRR
jgi:hypothetical protein